MALWVALIAGATALVPSHSVVAVEAPACALGTHYADESNNGYTVLRFTTTTPCDWTVPAGVTTLDVLLVGGGGGGGAMVGGGGGGGAVVTRSALSVVSAAHTIAVGSGGTGARVDNHHDTNPANNTFTPGTNGGNSTFASGGFAVSAAGGGVGGSWNGTTHEQLPGSGGSGGGSGSTTSAGSGAPGGNGGNAHTDGQPHAAGGGGGSGSVGLDGFNTSGGAGGLGTSLDFVTTSVFVNYGGGGGGAVHGTWSNSGLTLDTPVLAGGQGGPGGGGDGGAPQQSASGMVQGGDGTDGLGGGGGGAANSGAVSGGGSIGGNGGVGVVIVRWWNPVAQTITFTRPSDRVLSASTFDVAPISDSGLVVTVSSTTPSVCTVAGFTVTMLATGTCTLTASQAGNATYAAAPDVTRSFTISPASTTTVPPPPPSSTSTSSSTTTTTVPPPPPSSTSTSTTITPTTPTTPPAPLPADPATGGLPSLEPGTSLVTENGVPIAADLLMENQTDATLRGHDFALRLSLEREGWAQVSGEGFLPGTPVYAWLFSEPQFLGEFTVKADGTFAGRVPLTGVEVGSHTLQINGTSVDGAARSANLGVVVQDVTVPAPGPGALPSTGSGTGLMWLAVTALAGGALVTTARRRRPFHE